MYIIISIFDFDFVGLFYMSTLRGKKHVHAIRPDGECGGACLRFPAAVGDAGGISLVDELELFECLPISTAIVALSSTDIVVGDPPPDHREKRRVVPPK